MYIIYDIMQHWFVLLGYNLYIKSKKLTETQSFIANISHNNFYEVVDAISSANTYIHLVILILKQ